MRRVVLGFAVTAGLVAGLFTTIAAPAQARDGYDCRSSCRGDLGYWERPSDRRRYHRRYRPHYREGAHYYPGYGYYSERGYRGDGYDRRDRYDRYDDRRDRDRSAWCASRYRSYDWRSGTYVGYDGVRRYCG